CTQVTGIEYLPGGVASGFVTVEGDEYRTRLLLVKGKRVVRVSEVPCSADSLNTGDVFILDAGLQLYMWSGALANTYEKSKGVQTMQRIKDDERGGRASIIFVEEDPENAGFWEPLGGYMETSDTYILDTGPKVFVWVGKCATLEEKRGGMSFATQFVNDQGRDPMRTSIFRVTEGYETSAFKGLFDHWSPPPMPTWHNGGSGSGVAGSEPGSEVDMGALAEGMRTSGDLARGALEMPVDDGSGKLEIWRVEDFKLVPLPEVLLP
ncbi:unnamed protein product, partial [Discosporangium mesarthrocarpum]